MGISESSDITNLNAHKNNNKQTAVQPVVVSVLASC